MARAAARETGLSYARANVLFGPGGEAMALYRLEPVVYPLLGDGDKWVLQRRMERLVEAIEANFSLWRICRSVDPDAYVASVQQLRRAPATEVWDEMVATHRAALEAGGGREVETFVGVRLDEQEAGGFGPRALAASWRRARGPLSTGRLRALLDAEERLLERLGSVVDLRRARSTEVQWLLARAPRRGVGEPPVPREWGPEALVVEADDDNGDLRFEPLGWDLWRLPAAVICEEPGHAPSLHVEADEGDSFQASLCVGALAENPVFPGPAAELLHAPLDALDFPVDAVVHARWVGNREALGQVRRRVVDAEQVYLDQLESSTGPAFQADDDRTLAREYEQVLQSGARPPMLYASISLALGAETRELLERRVERLRTAFGEVPLRRPRGLQERLWLDHLPRADGGRVREYVQHITAQQFGAMVPTAGARVGDEQGLYLGHATDGTRAPVLLDVALPSQASRPGALLISGESGSGKSVTAQVISHGGFCRGARIVDIDPRSDHGWTRVPRLADEVDVLDLSGGAEQQGRLDPMVIAPPDLREELTISYLLELLRDPPASWERAIARAVRDVTRAPVPSTRAVIDRLVQLDDAGREVADALDVLADVGLARLGFGDGSAKAITSARRITTIRTPGLMLPEPGVARETYTRAERISVATLSLVASAALAIVFSDRTQHKIIILDEAWFLLSSPQGRSLINRLLRLARAYNVTVILVTQLVGDLTGTRELAATWLALRVGDEEEAERTLDKMGVDPSGGRSSLLHGVAPGVGVLRDLDGHIAPMRVHVPDDELLTGLDTVPGAGEES